MIVSGVGRLGQEPKMSFTPKGNAQTFLSVAVSCGWGENKSTVWFSLASWGAQAEMLNQYLSKGSRLAFSAELTGLKTYEKNDGSTGVTVNAKILTFEFLDKVEKKEETPYDSDEPEEF